MKIGIIMLAAGNSRRFGSNKLLYEIQGKPMFCYILDTLYDVQKNWEQLPGEPESCLEVSVVTQYDFIAEQAEKYGFRVYNNPAPERGISSSVRIGLEANQEGRCSSVLCGRPALAVRPDYSRAYSFLYKRRKRDCLCF